MQRRDFSRSLMAVGATASVGGLAAWSTPASAQLTGLKEGTDFVRLGRSVAVDAPAGQVEVLEFFAYTCIHCSDFEPAFDSWAKKQPAHVTVRRVPVRFSAAFEPMQRLYYALEAMNQLDALHAKVFRAIHVDKQNLTTPETITAWVVGQGLDRQKFTGVYNSFGVAGKAKRAAQLQDAYQVEGTPALGVAGRYYVPGQGPRALVVADALIAEVRKG
jgi:protein dithiol oxidoreductase (disulfide-forming)